MKKQILIVDDNSINRKYAKSVLSKANIDVTDASCGEDAIKLISEKHFDLVLLDIQMPGLDGFETLHLIKQKQPEVSFPVLAITAFYGDDGKSTFIEAGFDDFLRKPIKPDQLITVAESWLGGKSIKHHSKQLSNDFIVDLSVYHEIKTYARDADINDLYVEFEEETSAFFERLRFLIPAKNYPEILSTLHVIKGNSGSLGVNELALKTEKLEADIRTDQKLDLSQRIGELEDVFRIYKKDYKQLLNI